MDHAQSISSWLVVLTILKNMKVNGNDYPIYYGKYKMLETTNQQGSQPHMPRNNPRITRATSWSCPAIPKRRATSATVSSSASAAKPRGV